MRFFLKLPFENKYEAFIFKVISTILRNTKPYFCSLASFHLTFYTLNVL